jgi:hypothetical protein
MDCGLEKGGHSADEVGVCPASTEKRLSGANGGRYGGRACWVVTGTLCREEIQGTFHEKLTFCRGCPFHARVRREEGAAYVPSSQLLQMLKS